MVMLLPLLLLAAAAAFSGLYLLAYRRHVNRRLTAGRAGGRRWLSPAAAAIAALAAALAVYGVWASASGGAPDSRTLNAAYDCRVLTAEEMREGYPAAFSPDSNPGYEKTVLTDGGFTFTVFRSTDGYDRLHPQVIVYAAYTGSAQAAGFSYEAVFSGEDGTALTSVGGSGQGAAYGSCCVLASAGASCRFSLRLYCHDAAGLSRLKERAEDWTGSADGLYAACSADSGTAEIDLEGAAS